MKSLFEPEAFAEINERVEKLDENSIRQWGKMSHGQMVHHCQGPLNIVLQKNDYGLKPNWIFKTFFKHALWNDKLWRKGLPTVPQFKEREPRDFKVEKAKLQELIKEFGEKSDQLGNDPHPSFGKITKEQWGKMQYKHLDHHLRQFGV
ncbi:MAG: DUF1569 domain-containing protein [Flavobacteriaceae bacterium]|nr:DUF1569 domain-containing protein [Flavobacteriaceae bacterium]